MTNSIRNLFSEVPTTYEWVNHILTFGLDILWRRRAAGIAAMTPGSRWIDMCTGTGEMALYLAGLAPKDTQIYGVDFSLPMMREAIRKPDALHIKLIASDIKALPFPDKSFDLITISFATRNINVSKGLLLQSFSEFYRVLKPGGRFVNLETSRPAFSPLRICFHLYVKLFVELVGSRISGSGVAYAYLAKTIPRFYPPEALADIMHQAGFEGISFKRLLFGIGAIHQAERRE